MRCFTACCGTSVHSSPPLRLMIFVGLLKIIAYRFFSLFYGENIMVRFSRVNTFDKYSKI